MVEIAVVVALKACILGFVAWLKEPPLVAAEEVGGSSSSPSSPEHTGVWTDVIYLPCNPTHHSAPPQ
jgi:hypothetical protein